MFDKLIQLFFEKKTNSKKGSKVLTIALKQREVAKTNILNINHKEKDKKEETSLSKYFVNIEGLLDSKNSQASLLSSRKSRLQSQDFYQE